MLYVDTFGAFGGVGRCSIELLPFLAREMGKVTVARAIARRGLAGPRVAGIRASALSQS